MQKLMRIGEFSRAVGVSISTLRRMNKEGTLVPAYISESKFRYYTEEQVIQFSRIPKTEKIAIGYCRVPPTNAKNSLETQIQDVRTYMLAKGYIFEIIKDNEPIINSKKGGLTKVITKICQKSVSKLVILYRDILPIFFFDLIEQICCLYGCEIEIIDNTEKIKSEELYNDFIQIVTTFSDQVYGKKTVQSKKFIEKVKDLITNRGN